MRKGPGYGYTVQMTANQTPGPLSCSVTDCEKSVHARGMCQAHYRKFKKYGTASPTPDMKKKPGPAPDPTKWRSRHNTTNPSRTRRKANPKPPRTHCAQGHELTDENTYVSAGSGARHCRTCRLEAVKRYRESDPIPSDMRFGKANRNKTHCPKGHAYDEENTYYTKKGTRACRACRRANVRKQRFARYGMNEADFERLLEEQKGMCAICMEVFSHRLPPHIDHCHTTGQVRGLLCGKCNTALGQFLDSPEILYEAIEYITRNKLISP
jgi:hypothetical protein